MWQTQNANSDLFGSIWINGNFEHNVGVGNFACNDDGGNGCVWTILSATAVAIFSNE